MSYISPQPEQSSDEEIDMISELSNLPNSASGEFIKKVAGSFTNYSLSDTEIPDVITLTNITQITNRSHNDLQDLTADNHPQYIIDTGDTMTGALTLANLPNALNSGNYSLQMTSGVAAGSTAKAYIFNTSNTLTTTDKIASFQNAGVEKAYVRQNGYIYSGRMFMKGVDANNTGFDASGVGGFGGRMLFTAPNYFATIGFKVPGNGTIIGITPGASAFSTNVSGESATINFVSGSGFGSGFTFGLSYISPYFRIATQGINSPTLGDSQMNGWGDGPSSAWLGILLSQRREAAMSAIGYIRQSTDNIIIEPRIDGAKGIVAIPGNLSLFGTTVGSNLVINGDFTTDTSWTKTGGWSIANGVAYYTAGSSGTISQTISGMTIGLLYRLRYAVPSDQYSSGSVVVTFDNQIIPIRSSTSNGLYWEVYFIAKSTSSSLVFGNLATNNEFALDNVSIVPLTGGGNLLVNGTTALQGDITISNAKNIILDTATGTKIGTVGGASGQKLGIWGATPITQPAALTASTTQITYTEPGIPDYIIQDFTQSAPYGFVTADEAQTLLKVIKNLQTRVDELETKLKAIGLIQ